MCICNEQTEAAPRLWANFDPVSSSGGNACLLMQNFLYKIYHNRFNMHLFYCFFSHFFIVYMRNLSHLSLFLNILASWCQTCAVQAEHPARWPSGTSTFLPDIVFFCSFVVFFLKEGATNWTAPPFSILIRLMRHAECWDPSVGVLWGVWGGWRVCPLSLKRLKLCHCVLLD